MFEAKVIDTIQTINSVALLSTYAGRPSIFSGMAPEDVDFPYVVINIEEELPEDSIITRFRINVECFDYNTTEKNIRIIMFDITNALDNITLQHFRYGDIRIRRDIQFKIDVPDPRGIHYRMEFTARGSRTFWAKTIGG